MIDALVSFIHHNYFTTWSYGHLAADLKIVDLVTSIQRFARGEPQQRFGCIDVSRWKMT